MKEFKTPILSQIYNAMGWVIVVIGIILAIFSLLSGVLLIKTPLGGAGFLMSLVSVLVTLLITAIIALPFFGIAQVITYFGRTAYHSQSIDEGLKHTLFQMQNTMTAISNQLQLGLPPSAHSPENHPPVKTVNCPYCNVAIPRQAVHKGSNICPACRKEFEAG